MRRVLFLRKIRRVSGGQVKVRDYFEHCLSHPALEPYVYFTPDSTPDVGGLWADVSDERRVDRVEVDKYDLLFVAGRDWRSLPPGLGRVPVVNLIQGIRHADPDEPRFAYLKRTALRICVSEEVRTAIKPHASGEAAVIPVGIPLGMFNAGDDERREGSVLIWAGKNPDLGLRLAGTLRDQSAEVNVIDRMLPRADFAGLLRASDIFVALPLEREGFYLPALEAMASGCAVVCSDAGGNRSYCRDGETCLTPEYDDFDSHIAAVDRLLVSGDLRGQLRRGGERVAKAHSLDAERARFHALVEQHYPDLRGAPVSTAEPA